MNSDDDFLHQQVVIGGEESLGRFFVVDIIDSLIVKYAQLKSLNTEVQLFRNTPINSLVKISPENRSTIDFLSRIVIQGLKSSFEGVSQPYFHTNTIFKAYQFRPLLKFINNPYKRMLISDETGLGKTIEAGYIIVNEVFHSQAKKIVVLCPAHLKYKWKWELWHRFGLRFDILNGRQLMEVIRSPRKIGYCIASIDCMKNKGLNDLLNLITGSNLDLLIIDEIHNMIGRSGETLRREFGVLLSSISKGVIGITATPILLELLDLKKIFDIIIPNFSSEDEFYNDMFYNSNINKLCNLLSKIEWNENDLGLFKDGINLLNKSMDISAYKKNYIRLEQLKSLITDEYNDIKTRFFVRNEIKNMNTLSSIFTRTKRIDVGENRIRRVHNEYVELDTNISQAIQKEILVSVSEKELFNEIDALLQTSFHYIHRRQLASSLPALVDLLRGGARGFNVWVKDKWENIDVKLSVEEQRESQEIVNKFGLLGRDSKWEVLKEIVKDLRLSKNITKVIVFTQWIPTINYFRRVKQELDCPSFLISGEDNEYTREKILKLFTKKEGFAVLFTTDVMSEGIDILCANCIINYDLTYNPQKIEQRIGRVDRIGQKSDIIEIYNLIVKDSTDEKIYKNLLLRISVFEKNIDELPLILSESMNEKRVIDEYDVIRLINVKSIRDELLESPSLYMFDSLLDDDIESKYMRRNKTLYSLRWMAIERLMFLILGQKKSENTIISDNVLIYENINELDINTLVSLINIKNTALVKNELLYQYYDESIKYSFNSDEEGLFLSYFHPLMQVAINISYKSFYDDQKIDEIEPLYITIQNINSDYSNIEYLLLIELLYEGKNINTKKWIWWKVDESGKFKQLKDDHILHKLINDTIMHEVTIKFNNVNGLNFSEIYNKKITQLKNTWAKNMRLKDHRQEQINKELELWRIDKHIKKLNDINDTLPLLEKKQLKEKINSLYKMRRSSQITLNKIKKSDRHPYILSTTKSRIVAKIVIKK